VKHDKGRFQGAGGLELFYQRWRPEAEPHVRWRAVPVKAILVIIHGFGEHSGRYLNVVDHLVPRGYAIYGFDHRGHGRSPGKRGHIDAWSEFREDVDAFLKMVREQEPERPLFLMGHSMGGLIALEYTLRHPDGLRGIIASSPALATGLPPVLFFISRVLSKIWPRLGMDTKLDAAGVSRDPAVVEAYRNDPLVHSMGTPRLGTEMVAAMEWTMAHAADWCLPLLILHGGADQLVPAEISRAFFDRVTIADKKRIEYQGGYHESHNDVHHEQVTADLEGWLAQHLA